MRSSASMPLTSWTMSTYADCVVTRLSAMSKVGAIMEDRGSWKEKSSSTIFRRR